MIDVELKSKMVTINDSDEEEMSFVAGNVAKVDDVIEGTLATSGALQLEAESNFLVLKVAESDYCFVKDTSYGKLEDLQELKTSCALHHSV